MKIEVYGPGCTKCEKTFEKIKKIVDENSFDCELNKISDISKIVNKGVLMTPAVYVDDIEKITGKIPDDDTIISWF